MTIVRPFLGFSLSLYEAARSRSNYSHEEKKKIFASGIHKPVAEYQTISTIRNNVSFFSPTSWYVLWLFVGLYGFIDFDEEHVNILAIPKAYKTCFTWGERDASFNNFH